MDKFNELSLFTIYNSSKFFPLTFKKLINVSTFGHSSKNFKIFKSGKVTYCNLLKLSKNESSDLNDKISSCKDLNLSINDIGTFSEYECRYSFVNLAERSINEGIISFQSIPSEVCTNFKCLKFFCEEIKFVNPLEIASLNIIVNVW